MKTSSKIDAESAAARPGDSSVDVVGRHKRLVARTALIAGFTALSRVLGFGREALTAALFGDKSAIYDAFVTAWRIPNLFRRLLGEGAVSTSLQSALTEADSDRGEDDGRALLWETLRLATWILLGLTAVLMGGVALMGDAMPLTGWRWLGEDAHAMRELTLQSSPYVIAICLAGLISGALAVRGKFAATSAGPGVMNVVAIVTLVAIGLRFGWQGLAPEDGEAGRVRHLEMARWFSWGLLASGFVQLAMLVPEMRATGLLGRTGRLAEHRRRAWGVLRTAVPLALGAAVYQINVLVDSFMANNLLPTGGASTYYYANRIQQLPLALVATAAASAVFPAMKALAHKREFGELRKLHEQTHLAVMFVALPASVGLLVMATPVTAVLLQRGEFGEQGVVRTADAIRMLCIALVPGGAVGLLSRAYYALGDFKTPVRMSLISLVLNVALNWLFVVRFELDTGGLALATAIVSWVSVALLVGGLARKIRANAGNDVPGLPGFASRMAKMFGASLACGAAAWGAHLALGGETRSWLALALAIVCGIVTYIVAVQLLGLPEWSAVRRKLAARLAARSR
ncbi:MAG: murein biosynthesis integral membrane protein MurJ [Planctomycetes bacterium]|nr:murein biosynthesis integral membrane protein MurJ [Planctomycetota bacterium]